MTIKSFLYFSIYLETSFIGGPSMGKYFFQGPLIFFKKILNIKLQF